MNILPLHKKLSGGELARVFEDVCVIQWAKEDPQTLVYSVAQKILESFEPNSTEQAQLRRVVDYLAIEAGKSGLDNPYHNPLHTAHVLMMSAYFYTHNQDDFSETDYLKIIIAAIGHDLDHPGQSNPSDIVDYNESVSGSKVAEILTMFGIKQSFVNDVIAMIISTSPNGPHEYIKGERAVPYPKQERIQPNSKLMEITQILLDGDIFASSGSTPYVNKLMSEKLTEEAKKAGHPIDFTTAQSQLYFFEHVVGKRGFCSPAARRMANDNFMNIYANTKGRLDLA